MQNIISSNVSRERGGKILQDTIDNFNSISTSLTRASSAVSGQYKLSYELKVTKQV